MSEHANIYESFMEMLREQIRVTREQTREQTQAFLQAEAIAREEWQKKRDAENEQWQAKFDREKKKQDAEHEQWQTNFDHEKKERQAEFEKWKAEYERQRAERQAKVDAEFERSKAEYEKRQTDLDKKLSKLGNRIGEIVEEMVAGNIVGKFKALGYKIDRCGRRYEFGNEEIGYGEIDLYLEDGDIAVLIEVKTNLTVPDIKEHIERLQKFRRDCDRKEDKRRFIAAVAGAVVSNEARDFAHKQGMYVIVQSGDAVEILPVPKNFKAKEW